jgi:hypothetical protein
MEAIRYYIGKIKNRDMVGADIANRLNKYCAKTATHRSTRYPWTMEGSTTGYPIFYWQVKKPECYYCKFNTLLTD